MSVCVFNLNLFSSSFLGSTIDFLIFYGNRLRADMKRKKGETNQAEQTGHVRKMRPLFLAVPAMRLIAGLPHPHRRRSGGEF
jgi:hypothetical protein